MDLVKSKNLINAGVPPQTMTDKQWQEYFNILKFLVPQSKMGKMRTVYLSKKENYYGETNYSQYVKFINSVLSTIRRGRVDYCFFIYQISDLLKYEHDRLRTQYIENDKYFRVWLDDQPLNLDLQVTILN